jgi:hypothetical protein
VGAPAPPQNRCHGAHHLDVARPIMAQQLPERVVDAAVESNSTTLVVGAR